MTYFSERRSYPRCDNLVCKILMSTDGIRWEEVELCDISAGGLKFITESSHEVGASLRFNLYIYNMLSEFNMKMEGKIVRIDRSRGKNAYAVKFVNFNKYHQIQLDELIRSRITVSSDPIPVYNDEETYTFIIMPDVRKARRKMSRYR